MNLAEARAQFPGLKDKVFLDAACCSLAPQAATDAIRTFLDLTLMCPLKSSTHHHIFMDEMRAAARPLVAQLLNAEEDEIALVESTTQGLTLAANAIRLEKGDQVLISDLEFLQVALPWIQKPGISVHTVPNHKGEVRAEDFASRITPRTRVICLSAVQWNNGYRADLEAFSRLCRERKIWLVLYAIQQIGAIPLDVKRTPVDIVACGGHKWLNAPYGCGFLYIRREALATLDPPVAGYLSVQDPGGWDDYFQVPSLTPVKDYNFVPTTRRYENGGTANYPGAVGLSASLKLSLELGQEQIADHVVRLTDCLISGLDRLGIEVVTPRSPANRSGIVTFSVGSAEKNVALMNQLQEKRILVSVRYTSNVGGVRVSCHFYNNEEEIQRLLEQLKKI